MKAKQARSIVWLIVAVSFLFSSLVPASMANDMTCRSGEADMLAAHHQAARIGRTMLAVPAAGDLIFASRRLDEIGIHSAADVVGKLDILDQEGIMCIPLADENGREARYLFSDDGIILRVTGKEDVNDDLYQLLRRLGLTCKREQNENNNFDWFSISDQRQIGLINSFLADISGGKWGISAVRPAKKHTGRSVKDGYLREVAQMRDEGVVRPLSSADLRFDMTGDQGEDYLRAIREVLQETGNTVITPDLLFAAADRATAMYQSPVRARIGLQPGTMNPLHYGHITASLAAIISNPLDMVFLANGGTVPDKPYAASADIRNAMAREAVSERGLSEWLQVTGIRQQVVGMFNQDAETLKLAGRNEGERRFNMDMAAFIWLFRANPGVEWTYLVGSDKVANYGRKGERGLIVETLGDRRANAQVLYFAREGEGIDYPADIEPYDWLAELYDAGFFRRSSKSSFADLSATKVRIALVQGREEVDGIAITEMIPEGVLNYIRNNPTLMFLYKLEIMEKRGDSCLKDGNNKEALRLYHAILAEIGVEMAKEEAGRAVGEAVLEKLSNIVQGKVDEITADAGGPGSAEYKAIDLTGSKRKYEEIKDSFIEGYDSLVRIADDSLQVEATETPRAAQLSGLVEEAFVLLSNTFDGLAWSYELYDHWISLLGAEYNQGLPIRIRVNSRLPVNSARYYNDDTGEVEIIFNQTFIEELLAARDQESYAAVPVWLLAERLFHELGHDNVIGSPGEEREEEARLILRDLELYRLLGTLAIADVSKRGIDAYFATVRPTFPSGNYFRFLARIEGIKEWIGEIEQFKYLVDYFEGSEDLTIINLKLWQLAYRKLFGVDIQLKDLVKEEFFELVGENGRLTGRIKPRRLIHKEGDFHRDVRIFVFNENGELLVQKRGAQKDIEPSCYAESVGGHLKVGEKYFAAVLREMEEEIGVEDVQRERLFEIGTFVDDLTGDRSRNRSVYQRYVYVLTPEQEANIRIGEEDGIVREETAFRGLADVRSAVVGHENEYTASLVRAMTEETEYSTIREALGKLDVTGERVERLLSGNMEDKELAEMSAKELADILRLLDLSHYDMEEKFLLYSAAPGSGKGAVMDITFVGEGAPYSDLVQKLMLYHTRAPRTGKGERDGVHYHFGAAYVGDENRNRLLVLYKSGKIYIASVNKQLQGLARKDFAEVVRLHDNEPAEERLPREEVSDRGSDEFGRYIEVERLIKGLRSAFGDDRITILEGGYGWYRSIKVDKAGIFTIFISPFTNGQLALRLKNKMFIDANYKSPEDRLKAYWALNQKRKENGAEELDLTADADLRDELAADMGEPLEDYPLKEGVTNARHNAQMIESDQFITDLNRLLRKYFEVPFRIDTIEKKALARELAFEVQMKLISDRGKGSYRLERPTPAAEDTADFTKCQDTYNRVLEGVVQIMLRNEYKRNGTGAVVVNQFVWTGNSDDIEDRIKEISEEFCREYFTYLLRAINRSIKSQAAGEGKAKKKPQAASLSRQVDERKKEAVLGSVKIDARGNILRDTIEVREEGAQDERFERNEIMSKLQTLLEYLLSVDEGIFGPINEIVIVDNLGGIDSDVPPAQRGAAAYFSGRQMLIDIDVLENRLALQDVGVHESFEGILELVEDNAGLKEITATYSALRVLLEMDPAQVEHYIDFLKQKDNGLASGEYAQFLEYVNREGRSLGEDELISLVIGYLLNTDRYSHLREEIGEVLVEDVQEAQAKLELARNIYRDILQAKAGSHERLKAELKPVVRNTGTAALKARAIMKVNMLVSRLPLIELDLVAVLLAKAAFIKLDIDELSAPGNEHIIQWLQRMLVEKEESPFVFYSSSNEAGVAGFLADHGLRQGVIPAGHDARRVIDLRDLSAINSELSGDCLFLPLIYSVSSIYLAAQVVLAEGNIDQIEDKLAQTTLRALYQSLFGRPLSEDEWQQLFRGELLPPLEKLTGTLNSLRLAIIQVEKAA